MTKTRKFIIFGFILVPVSLIINETLGYLFLGFYTIGLIFIGIYQLFKKIRNKFSKTKEDKYLDKLKMTSHQIKKNGKILSVYPVKK